MQTHVSGVFHLLGGVIGIGRQVHGMPRRFEKLVLDVRLCQTSVMAAITGLLFRIHDQLLLGRCVVGRMTVHAGILRHAGTAPLRLALGPGVAAASPFR